MNAFNCLNYYIYSLNLHFNFHIFASVFTVLSPAYIQRPALRNGG